jgi:hypothetical protein
MKRWIRNKQWDNVAKSLKAHILGWQWVAYAFCDPPGRSPRLMVSLRYYYVDDIKDNLVRLVNRVEKRLYVFSRSQASSSSPNLILQLGTRLSFRNRS